MKNKKLVHIGRVLRPGGGPSGYLYNLKKIAEKQKSEIIKVFGFKISNERSGSNVSKAKSLILRLPYPVRKIYVLVLLLARDIFDIYSALKIKFILGEDFPVFHDQMLAYWYGRIFLKPYCLMPHQPVEAAREADNIYEYRYNLKRSDIYQVIVKREVDAYKNALVIICPTEYSLDGYFLENSECKNILDKIPKHTVISTVTIDDPVLSRVKSRQSLKVGVNSLAIGFIGRYNADKGYDKFLSIARAHRNDINIQFFSAGAGEITATESNVIDLGWRKDIADIISAMDLIVIPNNVTYFDLLPIESLMLGTPVAVSAVGGNKWLLEEVKDNSIQKLELNMRDGTNNLNKIINAIPSRAQFRNSDLFNYFSDANFVASHEALRTRIKDFGGRGS